jgi:Flp pilus assembly protein TadD
VAANLTARDQVDAISSALRARDYDRAVELTRDALKATPNDAQIWTLQGIALSRKGDTAGALEAYRRALTLSPDYIPALEGAAQLHYQAGSRDAVPLLTRLLRLRPGDPTSHAMLAVLEYREGNCQAAVGHFAGAGALLDSELDALHAYGTCLVRLKRFDDAASVFQRTVALRPDDARERRLLASIQLMASKPRDAIETLTPIIESRAVDAETLELVSSAYEEAGDTARAVGTLRQAILLDPRNPNLYVDFANIAFAHQSFQVGMLKFGYEGWFGDDVEPFQGPWSQPKFGFDNLLTLAQDAPNNENGVMYDPVTGQQKLWEWNAASRTWGAFAQDTWTARRNLTLTLGFRYDDQGNPYSRTDTTVFGNFYLGSGSTFQDQVASGVARPTDNALNRSPKAFNPRAGVAWDVTGKGDWVVRSGFGVYANWLTSANVQEEFRGNPPGLILPTFFPGSATPPIFTQGTSSTPPFGFTFPSLAGSALCPTAPCLDSKGGIAGAAAPIGGINPDLKTPTAYIYTAALEHKIGHSLAASVLYSGSHSNNLVGNGNAAGQVSYGVDINAQPGDLLTKPPGSAPTRLNPSFGQILYAQNDHDGAVHGRGRLQRRRRQSGLPQRHELRHEQIAQRVSERRLFTRTVHRARARHQRQREAATVPAAGFLGSGYGGLQGHAPDRAAQPPDPLRVLQPVQLRQPVSRQRPVERGLRKGHQPAAAQMVAVRRETDVLIRGASRRRTPLHARSRGPLAPLRARGSLALLVRSPRCPGTFVRSPSRATWSGGPAAPPDPDRFSPRTHRRGPASLPFQTCTLAIA